MDPANFTLTKATQEALQVPNAYSGTIDGRILCEIIKMVKASSKNIRGMEDECAGLESRNKMLLLEITQLKSMHSVELNATVDSCIAVRDLIVETIKGIIERLTSFSANFKLCGCTAIDTNSFRTLKKEVSKFNYDGLKIYPEPTERRLNKPMPLETAAIVPTSDTILPTEVQSEILKLTEETKILEGNVESLRAENQALMAQKEVMIDFHRHHLEDLNKREKQGRIKQAIERVRAIYESIKWEIPFIDYTVCPTDDIHAYSTPIRGRMYHDRNQKNNNHELKHIQEHVLAVVLSLETLMN